MLYPFRHPLIIQTTNKSNIVIFEYSVGRSIDSDSKLTDAHFEDTDISQDVEKFVQYVYDTIPDEYTTPQYRNLIMACRVNRKSIANSFLEHLGNRNKEEVLTARLLIIFQDLTIRFSVHFVEHERDYVSDLPIEGCSIRAVASPVKKVSDRVEYRILLTVDLSKDIEKLNRLDQEGFYRTDLVESVQNFLKYIQTSFDTLGRTIYQNYRSKLLASGCGVKAVSSLVAPQCDEFVKEQLYDQLLLSAVAERILDRNRNKNNVTSQSVTLETKLTITNPKGPPEISLTGDVYSFTQYKYEDGTKEEIYKSFDPLDNDDHNEDENNEGNIE